MTWTLEWKIEKNSFAGFTLVNRQGSTIAIRYNLVGYELEEYIDDIYAFFNGTTDDKCTLYLECRPSYNDSKSITFAAQHVTFFSSQEETMYQGDSNETKIVIPMTSEIRGSLKTFIDRFSELYDTPSE